MAKVNIVLPCRNRAELAEQTIVSLYEHTPKEDINVWVYADGPDGVTGATLAYLQKKYGFILYENLTSQGPGWCRNIICRLLSYAPERAKFLYHTDSDVYFLDGWLDDLIHAYDIFHDKVKLFGAGCHPYLHTNQVLEKDGVTVHTKDAIPGFTAFMDWDTWQQYGPYNEFKGIMGSEDWAFCQKIVKDNFFVASIMPEKVVHCGRTNSNNQPATGSELMGVVPGHPEIKIL